jgi:hypothetical protein
MYSHIALVSLPVLLQLTQSNESTCISYWYNRKTYVAILVHTGKVSIISGTGAIICKIAVIVARPNDSGASVQNFTQLGGSADFYVLLF